MPANSQSWQRLLHERGRLEGQPSSLSPGPAAMAERLWAQTRFPSRPLSALAVEKYLEAGAFGSRYRSRLHYYVRASASRVVCRRGQGSVTRTHARTHTHTHARTRALHTHTHTHAHTHARTHKHTHALVHMCNVANAKKKIFETYLLVVASQKPSCAVIIITKGYFKVVHLVNKTVCGNTCSQTSELLHRSV